MPQPLTLVQAIAKVQVLADATEETDVEFISDLLQASAGINLTAKAAFEATALMSPVANQLYSEDELAAFAAGTTYRTYYVAARRLQTNLEIQALSKAEQGVTFTGQIRPIETYLNLQLGIDLSTPLIVPPGFTTIEALNELCGCKGGGSALAMSAFVI
jgi:hypothetical protein